MKLLHIGDACREHEGLIPVISGPEITRLKKLGCSYLSHFFPISKYAKLPFSGKYFPAT